MTETTPQNESQHAGFTDEQLLEACKAYRDKYGGIITPGNLGGLQDRFQKEQIQLHRSDSDMSAFADWYQMVTGTGGVY